MAKKKQRSETSDQSDLNFESSIEEVEKVVESLESGELGLSESLQQYERGIEHIKRCHQVLQRAEQKILLLMRVDEDGTPHTEPIEMSDRSGQQADSPGTRKAGGAVKKRPPSNMDDEKGLF